MPTLITNHKKVIVAAGAGFLLAILVSAYVSYTQAIATDLLQQRIAVQEAKLQTLGDLIRQDRADAEVSAIVRDCAPEARQRYDAQLGKLNTLRGAELSEMQILFADCGDFFVVQRAVMVARLGREIEVYKTYAELQSTIRGQTEVATGRAATWQALLDVEKVRSELGTQLVTIQGQIITLLADGMLPTNDDIAVLLTEAQEVRENLSFIGMQVDARRGEIESL